MRTGGVTLIVVVISMLAILCVIGIGILMTRDNTAQAKPPVGQTSGSVLLTGSGLALVGKWKCEKQMVTQTNGPTMDIPYTGIDKDLEFFNDGQYVDDKEEIRGVFTIVDSNHVRFTIHSAKRLPKGFTFVNEFAIAGDKLTLRIVKNPPGIERHEILYTRR